MVNNIKEFNFTLMENLKMSLEIKLSKILGFIPEGHFNYDKASDSYIFSLKGDNERYSFKLNFRILYEDREDALRRHKNENKGTTKSTLELKEIINEIQDIKYAIITCLLVKPQNTGVGKIIVDILINEIKRIDKIEKVYLHPKNIDAERFWDRFGFYNTEEKEARNAYGYNKVITIKTIHFDT